MTLQTHLLHRPQRRTLVLGFLCALLCLCTWQLACEDDCNQCEANFKRCTPDGKFIELCRLDPLSYCLQRAIQPCQQGACVTTGGVASCQTCGVPCQQGTMQCRDNILERCEASAGGACVQFVTAQVCSGGCDPVSQSCRTTPTPDGGPPPGCTRTNPTAKRGCKDNAIHWLDNCDVPTQKIAVCPAGQRCTGGRCLAPCQSDCPQEGTTMCQGPGVLTCEKAADGCTYWGKSKACSSRKCENGKCQGATCPNRCLRVGEQKCDGKKVVTCRAVASDCTEWSMPEDCQNGTSCSGGKCIPGGGCNNECGVGMTRCSGNSVQTCEEDDKGCFLYSSGTDCPQGQTCQNGSCL